MLTLAVCAGLPGRRSRSSDCVKCCCNQHGSTRARTSLWRDWTRYHHCPVLRRERCAGLTCPVSTRCAYQLLSVSSTFPPCDPSERVLPAPSETKVLASSSNGKRHGAALTACRVPRPSQESKDDSEDATMAKSAPSSRREGEAGSGGGTATSAAAHGSAAQAARCVANGGGAVWAHNAHQLPGHAMW